MSNWSHSSLRASSDRPYSRRMCSASCLRPSRTAEAATVPPPSSRRVERNRSSISLPFQAFHTFGLVPRMSATVSRYSATSQRSALHHVGEAADHRFVGEVLLLRDLRHRQVVPRRGTRPARCRAGRARARGRSGGRRARRARCGRRRAPWRCRGRAPRCTAATGLSKSAISWLHSGYSCACSASEKRRRLRSTWRMCWSTV